ncbi:hypothetical protein ACFPAF_07655 [Hymenobacter endophyticus]|uniref:Uncharacterized protein n=1 Tax=Hymenobacter endophyticus TaxID=3076335 RepID=A0ABU3TG78_9BACT|nr:hypothetical protein [Hymenobacter endophyticus]MDU0370260.1 hypothetical protein [Hymenobacter endophyticus]
MKKLLLLVVVLLGLAWLLRHLLPPALPTAPHLAAVPVVKKPHHSVSARPKHVSLPGR